MTELDTFARVIGYVIIVCTSIGLLSVLILVAAVVALRSANQFYEQGMRLVSNHRSAAIILRWHRAWERGEPMPEEVKSAFQHKEETK